MQPQVLIHFRVAVLFVFVGTAAVTGGAASDCTRLWTIPELVRAGSRLDGQVVCVRSVLRPLPLRDRTSPSVFVYEAIPRRGESGGQRVGLLAWDKELGIDESLYRPSSEDLLTKAAARCGGITQDELSFDVNFRAVVEYRKGLTERAYSALPPALSAEKPRRTRYDIELVLLEVLKATAICHK